MSVATSPRYPKHAVDPTPRTQSVNPRTMPQLRGRRWGRMMVALIFPQERLEEEILVQIRGERVNHFETVPRSKANADIPFSVKISPVRNRLGDIIGASSIMRDVIEHR